MSARVAVSAERCLRARVNGVRAVGLDGKRCRETAELTLLPSSGSYLNVTWKPEGGGMPASVLPGGQRQDLRLTGVASWT